MEKTAGKPIRCRAAVCRKPGEALVIEEIEVAPPKAYELRIKILCTSLCHSDVTFWRMPTSPVSIFPRIFGHEAVGVRENVTDVKVGEIVVPVFLANCEYCRDCKSNKSNTCTSLPFSSAPGMPRDGTSRFTGSSGETLHNFLGVGCFSEYTVVDIAYVAKVSPEMPIDKACLLSCGYASSCFSVDDFDVIKEMTDGGADYCFECIGLASLMNDAFSSCRDGWGKTIILGVEMHGAPLSINTYELLKGKRIEGSLFGGIKAKTDIPLLAQSYLNKELHLNEFITHEIDFEDINTAFDLLIQGKSLRCIIWMNK
ncbi:hypothetical protein MKW94_016271 [Papaver nudicaule]|uniref:Alcohol dehydrogenase-like 7 n=1 Tax=Papaver nudicaule TaxID=74823 RepID=A0AA41SCE8_PAPNU|nr:hypothetical protein [Papaver nudicaule]